METTQRGDHTHTTLPRGHGRRWAIIVLVGVLAAIGAAGTWTLTLETPQSPPRPVRAAASLPPPEPPLPKPRPRVVRAVAPGEAPAEVETADAESEPSAAADDDEVRRDVGRLRAALRAEGSARGKVARVDGRGYAHAPLGAPQVVAQVVKAGNVIARKPYRWGGGHAGWRDTGYDCSGSMSFALAGAGLLDRPLDSSGFMRWGSAGRGRWITIYANPGHAFMAVAGLRFDTSGRGDGGTRWQEGVRGGGGYRVRHPAGL